MVTKLMFRFLVMMVRNQVRMEGSEIFKVGEYDCGGGLSENEVF